MASGKLQGNKLARPPVKLACLSCRASRIRCDGKQRCTNCCTKDKSCVYTKSKRGGPRYSLKKAPRHAISTEPSVQIVPSQSVELPGEFQPDFMADLVLPMIQPGAGLRHLDSDQIFDNLFASSTADAPITNDGSLWPPVVGNDICRAYRNERELLNAYYIFVHPYFPILPPPDSSPLDDDPLPTDMHELEPSSPLTLSLLAIITLIPHPQDPNPRDRHSVLLRRQKAQTWAELAMESIETESDLLTSSISPSEGLSDDPPASQREPLHPQCPVELESLLAYLVLSTYEYAQRGNLVKMRNRASQAYDAAIRLGLQNIREGSEHDPYAEANRRAWWMTYMVVLQSSIVSSLPPIIHIDRGKFRTPLPSTKADPESWPCLLDAQQLILQCTQFTVALKKALEAESDMTLINSRAELLDKGLDDLVARYSWNSELPLSTTIDPAEAVLASCLKSQAQIKLNSARIKLHRYRAFLDTPIFTRRHCDLSKAGNDDLNQLKTCCTTSFGGLPSPDSDVQGSSKSSSIDPRGRDPLLTPPNHEQSMFTNLSSAKTCMKAALNISYAFQALPFPNPDQDTDALTAFFLSSVSNTHIPRTMPAFACCTMQASYALLMICRKSQEWNGGAVGSNNKQQGLEEIHAGLSTLLDALTNYSIAFEALDGMRSQVQEAFDMVRRPLR